MIPTERLPGFGQWGRALGDLLLRTEPLWIYGEGGCGASTLGVNLASLRAVAFLDDADGLSPQALELWLHVNPSGVLAAHRSPPDESGETGPVNAGAGLRYLQLRIPALAEDPASIPGCLEALAEAEGCPGDLPPALGRLPCPGNLRGLHNRVVRWKLLGQLPEDGATALGEGALPLDCDDLATNLHRLECLLLHRVLRRSYGNRVEAAQRLGVSRRQLYLLIARHGDPVRGEAPTSDGPKRLGKARMRQNSSPVPGHR